MSPVLIESFRTHFVRAMLRGRLWVEIQSKDGKLRWFSDSRTNAFCDFRDKFTYEQQEQICPEILHLQRDYHGTTRPFN